MLFWVMDILGVKRTVFLSILQLHVVSCLVSELHMIFAISFNFFFGVHVEFLDLFLH